MIFLNLHEHRWHATSRKHHNETIYACSRCEATGFAPNPRDLA